MRKPISILIASALALSLTHTVIAQHSHREHEQEQEKMQKYTCLMHPEVIADHPGNCQKCGMKLVPIKPRERGTPNSDESRAGVQRSTSSSDHLMHDGAEMTMPHHDHGGHEMH